MGILNVTPDSFYDGGRYCDVDRAVEKAFSLVKDGADILDIGGESTRPGAAEVSPQEEMDRVCPVIEKISKMVTVPVSVDTTKSSVAEAALKAGASIVNDISGLTFDEGIAAVAARYSASIVLMHIQGTPRTMQVNPRYSDLLSDIYAFLDEAVQKAVSNGVEQDKIIVDPGIGFGKSLEDNYRIIQNLSFIKKMGYPVLIGLSRKSLIGNLYGDDSDRLPGTLALNTVAALRGADILRVHDVKEHKLAFQGLDMLQRVS